MKPTPTIPYLGNPYPPNTARFEAYAQGVRDAIERPIMTNQQKPEALRPIARYKIGYHTDDWGMRSSTPSGVPDPAGAWVRYEDHVAALVEAQQPAPSAAEALSDDLRDRLVAISEAIADQDDRAAQSMIREILKAPQPAPTPQADSQYLAGVSAGWNAANADDPNAALQKLHESRAGYLKPLSAARATADSVLEDAARWQWLSEHIAVAWNEGKFTSLVRIVSDKHRKQLGAIVDRMRSGDWSDVDAARKQGGANG